jgi:hypothetical protein
LKWVLQRCYAAPHEAAGIETSVSNSRRNGILAMLASLREQAVIITLVIEVLSLGTWGRPYGSLKLMFY